MKAILTSSILLALFSTLFYSCKKDEETDVDGDNALYSEISMSGYTYYQNGDLLTGVSPSPHGSFRLRFNATALAALDSTGELPAGSSFPNGSVIVKEVGTASAVSLYAVMKKDPSNSNAGSGWLWAEYEPGGSVAYSVARNGEGCISCHSGTPNRDLTRTFDLH